MNPTTMAGPVTGMTLSVLVGPPEASCSVLPGAAIVIGRARSSDICLSYSEISRRHATVVGRGSGWYILDHASLTGTHVNGVRAPEQVPVALSAGDSIRIGPCVLRVSVGAPNPATATIDDTTTPGSVGSRIAEPRVSPAADRRLKLLTDCLGVLAGAPDERSLADLALRAVLTESGYARGALLRRIDGGHSVEVVGSQRREPDDPATFAFSRSLVQRAAGGSVAILTSDRMPAFGESIADLRIHSALCAPVVVGGEVEGYLYLDARGRESSVRAEADGFCDAIAKAYGLALANLKRADLERRQAALQAQLEAARVAQQFILPPRRAEHGFVRYAMEMRAGLIIAGDLFDCVPLPDGRVAVAIGDVSGHGAGSGMVMAAVQAHLNASLAATGDPAEAARTVNRYLAGRASPEHFVTLWVGVFSPAGDLLVVDAGHGYWALKGPDRPPVTPGVAGAIPVGIDPQTAYTADRIRLRPGDRVVLYSDGIVEQRGESGTRFGRDALHRALTASSPDGDVAAVFEALAAFSGGAALTDDATAASVEYRGGGP